MLMHYDEDEWESVHESTVCGFHRMYPGKTFAGCCCSFSVSQKRRPPAEVKAIKEQARLKREDAILAQADAIRRQRAP